MQTTVSPRASTETFLAEAAELLGPKGFTTLADDIEPWETDWRGRYTGRALALASPASTAEVSALVKLCSAHAIPIVPQGGNSGMSGGATRAASRSGETKLRMLFAAGPPIFRACQP